MAIETSVFAQANRPTVALQNPNDVLLQTAQAANAVNQNRLFQANQSRGQLMQQAIDPSTGQFSPTAFNRLLAQTPAAALAAPEAVGQSQGLMGSQNELATRQNQFMSQSLGAVLATPDAQLHDAAANAMTRAVSAGLLPPEQAMRQMIMLPNDPAQLRQHLTQVQMSLLPPGAQQEATYGTPSTRDTGQGVESGTTAPARLGGGFTPNSTTQVYPSRSQLVGQQTGVDASGAPTATTTADRLRQQGRDDLTGPAGTPPGGVPSALLPKGYTGRYAAGGQAPPAAPSAGAPAAASAAPAGASTTPSDAASTVPSGAVQTGLAPGQAEEAQSSVAHLAQARDAANTYATRIQPLMSAQAALKDARTGAGSETLNNVRQLIGQFTPAQLEGVRSVIGLGTDQGDAAFDEARKYLTNYAANTPGANRSDAGGATAANANANVHISPLAARQVVQAAIGMERMKQAQVLEFNQSGAPGSQYDRSQAQLATKADPRAFMADMQTPDERKAMLGKMMPSQQANYLASVRLGMKHGLVSLGGG